MTDGLEAAIERAVAASPVSSWGISVRSADGDVLVDHGAEQTLGLASVGKVLLLLATADGLATGRLASDTVLDRRGVEPVTDSGLWQHLTVDALPLVDVARLVAATSDNLATNVLLAAVGLAAVDQATHALGLEVTRLHDRVRDERGPDDPPRLSSGSAAELSALLAAMHRDATLAPGVGPTVLGWLRTNTDLSMVAAGFGLDPLAHADVDRGLRLADKTGTDAGVRADVGLLTGPRATVAYAAIANWTPSAGDPERDTVLAAMRSVGGALRAHVEPTR